jgi:hypothetical protein
LKLVDKLITSDDYLLLASNEASIYEVTYTVRKNLIERCSLLLQKGAWMVGM